MGRRRQPQPFPPLEQGLGLGHPSVTPGRAGIQHCRNGQSHLGALPACAGSPRVNPDGRGREQGCEPPQRSGQGWRACSQHRLMPWLMKLWFPQREQRAGGSPAPTTAQARHTCGRIWAGTRAWDSLGSGCSASLIAVGCAACKSNRGELAFYKLSVCVCVQIKQMVRVFTLALMLEVLRLSSFLARLGPNLGWEHHFKKSLFFLLLASVGFHGNLYSSKLSPGRTKTFYIWGPDKSGHFTGAGGCLITGSS